MNELQTRITDELLENFTKLVHEKGKGMPDHWDGVEIRFWLEELFRDNFSPGLPRYRGTQKRTKNDIIVNNLT